MHLSYSLGFLLMLTNVVVCQKPQGPQQVVAFKDSMLAHMIRFPFQEAREMATKVAWGVVKTLDPGNAARGGPRRPQRQSQRGGFRQQGRVVQEDEDYDDYYDNFEDISYNNYDYSASTSGEFNTAFPREPAPTPPNLPFRNNNNIRIRNKTNNFRNSGAGRFNRQDSNNISGAPRQFNRPQIINDLIQRSGLNGPYYPYPTYVGKKK